MNLQKNKNKLNFTQLGGGLCMCDFYLQNKPLIRKILKNNDRVCSKGSIGELTREMADEL